MQENKIDKKAEIVKMIQNMASAMGFPKFIIKMLGNLDMSVATDEQVGQLYDNLNEVTESCPPAQMAQMLQRAKEMQN